MLTPLSLLDNKEPSRTKRSSESYVKDVEFPPPRTYYKPSRMLTLNVTTSKIKQVLSVERKGVDRDYRRVYARGDG